MAQFEAVFNETVNEFTAEFNEGVQPFNASMDQVVKVFPDVYDGDYEVTPSAETQTLSTKNRTMVNDITINPIPSNYGLITWNGSTITVS